MFKAFATAGAGWTVESTAVPMTFPAGERHIVTEGALVSGETPRYLWLTGSDANDYVTAAMWTDYAHQAGATVTALIPYLPGARQDRGNPFGAKVYAGLINSIGADQVVCFDPHSPVMPGLVERLRVVEPHAVVAEAVGSRLGEYAGIICPDDGARVRAEKTAAHLGLPVYHARKKRDFATGRLSGFSCEPLPAKGRLLVVDDICDGGGTFRGLATATRLGPDRLDLWVSHGVFSGQAPQLREHYGTIHTTDSHPGAANPDVGAVVHPLLPHLLEGC